MMRNENMKIKQYAILLAVCTSLLCIGCGASKNNTATPNTGASEITESTENDDTVTNENKDNLDESTETIGTKEINAEETNSANIDTNADGNSQNESENGLTYKELSKLGFEFCSGAGGWCTELQINEDGSFIGTYHDSEMGDTGVGYPNGSMYYCGFAGQFTDLIKIDDLTYKTTISSISYDNECGTEEIIDEIRYIYTDAYGLDDPKDIIFYLPGTKTETFTEDEKIWLNGLLYDYETQDYLPEINFIAMVNKNSEQAFTSYEITQ